MILLGEQSANLDVPYTWGLPCWGCGTKGLDMPAVPVPVEQLRAGHCGGGDQEGDVEHPN